MFGKWLDHMEIRSVRLDMGNGLYVTVTILSNPKYNPTQLNIVGQLNVTRVKVRRSSHFGMGTH